MRSFVVFLVAFVLAALATRQAHAAGGPKQRSQPPPLYSLDSTPRTPTGGPAGLADAAEEYLIAIDPQAVAVNPQAFTINLPTLPPLEAIRTRFVVYRTDWKSWIGTLRYAGTQGEGTGYIHLGYHGKQVTALIHFEGERFQIVGGFWEPHRLVRLSDELSVRSCGLDDSGDDAEPLSFGSTSANAELDSSFEALTSTRLDVLVVYPKVFFGFGPTNEVAVFNFAEDSISLANDIFTNGNIPAYYNLVGIVPITAAAQPPATGIGDALDWLTQQPAEVASLRNAFGADIVTIYVPYIWTQLPACGVANLPQKDYATFRSAKGTTQGLLVSAPFNQRAFSANRVSCGLGDFTLGHEIGHNYGMRHETGNTSTTHLFATGRGYDIPGLNKSTVMGCQCGGQSPEPACGDPTNAVCNRDPVFLGPCTALSERGDRDAGSQQCRGRSYASSTTGYTIFRAQSANTPPFANFTVACSGRTCTFNASSSTDNMTIPTNGYWWDFGDNTTGAGKIVSHTYGAGTSFWVHLVVKDSGGQTDVTLNSATPQ